MSRQREYQKRNVEMGLCKLCGKRIERKTGSLCDHHREMKNRHNKESIERKKAAMLGADVNAET